MNKHVAHVQAANCKLQAVFLSACLRVFNISQLWKIVMEMKNENENEN